VDDSRRTGAFFQSNRLVRGISALLGGAAWLNGIIGVEAHPV
jgi:hypothetical protein